MALLFTHRLIQAPLAGYSCMPFRLLAWEFGGLDFAYTEMLSANHIYSGARQKPRYIQKAANEGPLCFQLAGNKPEVLAHATEQALTWGADLIDLNCGCPKPKIRKKKLGSQLLADSQHLYQLIKAINDVSPLPVLVKIRVDGDSNERFNSDVAKAIQDAGAAALTVHGRHWTENYDTPVHYDQIAEIKQTVNIPVIGNGDISDSNSARRMLHETGCDALMIARASVGRPWLFAQIDAELKGKDFHPPNLQQRGTLFLRHIKALMQLDSPTAGILQARALAKYYLREQATAQSLQPFYTVDSIETLETLVNNTFITR